MNSEAETYKSLDKSALISKIIDVEKQLEERDFEIEKLQLHIINSNNRIYGNKTEKLSSCS